MAESPVPPYRVDHLAVVSSQLRALSEIAKSAGLGADLFITVRLAFGRLALNPHAFGEPSFRTRREGGIVCRAVVWPIVIHYAVFDPDGIAMITELQAIPGTPLDRN